MSSLSVRQRAIGCMVGCLVADAATVPIHWIYNGDTFKTILSQYERPEFIPKSYSPFYNVPTGYNSCYGNQMVSLMKSIVACNGFNKEDYKNKLMSCFGPGTDYDVESKLGRPMTREDCPIEAPWTNGSIKTFLTNMAMGSKVTGKSPDAQADAFSKVAPLVALYAGDDQLLTITEDLIRVTQECDTAVKYAKIAALIIEQYILHGRVPDVIDRVTPHLDEEVASSLIAVTESLSMNHWDAVHKFGVACSLPGSFQGALHATLSCDGDFVSSVRSAIGVAGDNCARTEFVGACAGAWYGLEGIPEEWIDKMTHKDIVAMATQIADLKK